MTFPRPLQWEHLSSSDENDVRRDASSEARDVRFIPDPSHATQIFTGSPCGQGVLGFFATTSPGPARCRA